MKNYALLAVWILGASSGAACSRQVVAQQRALDAPSVAVAKVTTGDVAQVVSVAAEFRPFQEIDVHAKVAGYLKAITVDVGDRVRAGQLLATLEVPELQDELRQGEAAVKRAEHDITRAQSEIDRADSAHQVAHLAAERLSSVVKTTPNLVAKQDLDEASSRDRVAEAQVASAKAALAAAEEQLAAAKAGESKSRTVVAYSQITAPFSGVITRRYADTGAMIQAGTASQTQSMPIVRLSQNSLLRLVIPVPESAVAQVHVGSPVDVTVDALKKHVTGTVARIADRLDQDTRTMRVEVDVANADLALVPGMFTTAALVLDKATHVLVAPVESLDRRGDAAEVLLVNGDHTVERRPVVVGLESGDRVEIKSGLHGGDLVVVGNRAQLKPGTAVTPRLMESASAASE
jgi:RND family efflux transporter MFP subunit